MKIMQITLFCGQFLRRTLKWNGATKIDMVARMFHESLAATPDMGVPPGVLGCRLLRCTVQVRLGTNTLRLPSGTPIFMVSRHQFMKHPGQVGVGRKITITGASYRKAKSVDSAKKVAPSGSGVLE